jgi:hypothetical protein
MHTRRVLAGCIPCDEDGVEGGTRPRHHQSEPRNILDEVDLHRAVCALTDKHRLHTRDTRNKEATREDGGGVKTAEQRQHGQGGSHGKGVR